MDETVLWFINAFFQLSRSRRIGMSVGGIPISEMRIYWLHVGRIGDFEEFADCMGAMDATYIAHTQDEQKAKLEQQKSQR